MKQKKNSKENQKDYTKLSSHCFIWVWYGLRTLALSKTKVNSFLNRATKFKSVRNN